MTLLAGYGLFDPVALHRYLLPVIALTVIPAADGITRLVAARRWRVAPLSTVAAFLLAGLVTQHYVLRAQAASLIHGNAIWLAQASYLRHAGVRPPCIISGGHLPAAYYLGCASAWDDQHLPALLAPATRPQRLAPPARPGMRILAYHQEMKISARPTAGTMTPSRRCSRLHAAQRHAGRGSQLRRLRLPLLGR